MILSAPRLISPMLDDFTLGTVFFTHEGVRCCHAIHQKTKEKYIVKIISIPSSQEYADALLMSKVYLDRGAMRNAFLEQARDILREAKILRSLHIVGGFVDYDCIQVVPAGGSEGFDIYLLSPERASVAEAIQEKRLTQLDAINMGIDLCAALATCRRAGYLYVDLKPGNVFSDSLGYRIGDLGFMAISSLKTSSLPEKYRSTYSPAEVLKENAVMNETADVYALGMLLYELYNGGKLPEQNSYMGAFFAPPMYADYELSEIILRACAKKPSLRWQDPLQMGQALLAYQRRNHIEAIAIVPKPLPQVDFTPTAEVEAFLPDEPDDLLTITHPAAIEDEMADSSPDTGNTKAGPSFGRLTVAILVMVLLLELFVGGLLYYKNVYQQKIKDISVSEVAQTLTVQLTTKADDELLTVVCSGNDGSTWTSPVTDGKAIFDNLKPDTSYEIRVEISGTHQLTGVTSIFHTTKSDNSNTD